jgi:hypothetical protein
MKLKLVSDGIAMRTKVINAETGEPLEGIESISWEINAMDRTSRMTLTFVNIPVEVYSEDIRQVFGNIPRNYPQRVLIEGYDRVGIDTQSGKEIPPDIALIGKPRKFNLEE